LDSIGVRLRTIRRHRQLSLREVEERSLRVAQERGDQACRISASWLDRLEREKHELTVNKLIVLAGIYDVPPEQLLPSVNPGNPQPALLRQLSGPNATILLTGGPLDEQAKYLLASRFDRTRTPDETTLLSAEIDPLPAPYKRGIIGKRDRTLDPMIPPGTILHINTQKRAIASRKDWTQEFRRPVYFLMTRDGYVCGWCELDKNSEWPQVEVPNRNRKPGTCCRRGDSTGRMNLDDRRERSEIGNSRQRRPTLRSEWAGVRTGSLAYATST
jgi:transcriptional regulator with XRE-family HTH domain